LGRIHSVVSEPGNDGPDLKCGDRVKCFDNIKIINNKIGTVVHYWNNYYLICFDDEISGYLDKKYNMPYGHGYWSSNLQKIN